MRSTLLLTLLSLAVVSPLCGQITPSWWNSPQFGIWDGYSNDNFSPANVGQLKYVSTRAKAYLDSQLSLTVADWNAAFDGAGNNPFPFATGADPENASPVNVGQAKYISLAFYRILDAHGYPLRKSFLFQGANEVDLGTNGGTPVPWSSFPLKSENASPLNLGQLRMLFSFSVSSSGDSDYNLTSVIDDGFAFLLDNDDDLFSDAVETVYGLSDSQPDDVADLLLQPENSEHTNSLLNQGGGGPVIVVPDKGFYLLDTNTLELEKL